MFSKEKFKISEDQSVWRIEWPLWVENVLGIFPEEEVRFRRDKRKTDGEVCLEKVQDLFRADQLLW